MKKATRQTNKEQLKIDYLMKSINEGLKFIQPLCPSCNRKILGIHQVGTFGMDRAPSRDFGYLVCKSCTPYSVRLADRIAKRMEQQPAKYLFPMPGQVSKLSRAGIHPNNFQTHLSNGEGTWIEQDLQFFQQNYQRTTYLRRLHVGEFQGGIGNAVLIRQISTGTHLRLPIMTESVDLESYDEEFCCMLWEMLQANGSASESDVVRLKRGSFHA